MSVSLPYSLVIRWSDADRVYVAHLPEFGSGAKTHGESYVEAATNAQEVLEMLVESYLNDGKALPAPQKYGHPVDSKIKCASPFGARTKRSRQLAK